MISLTRVKEATSEFIKVLRYGKSDVQTADSVSPFGIDSKPVKDQIAVFCKTSDVAQSVILGYLNNSDKTEEGEFRIYATDSDGSEVFDILLKNDGTCEIGGSGDFLVKYNGLNLDFQAFILELNTKLAAAFSAVGGSWPGITLDISNGKIDNIKTSA